MKHIIDEIVYPLLGIGLLLAWFFSLLLSIGFLGNWLYYGNRYYFSSAYAVLFFLLFILSMERWFWLIEHYQKIRGGISKTREKLKDGFEE